MPVFGPSALSLDSGTDGLPGTRHNDAVTCSRVSAHASNPLATTGNSLASNITVTGL